MSWIVGNVTLPAAPSKVTKKKTFAYKKSVTGIETPWLFSMGPDITQLALEGEVFQSSKSLTTMYNNYISKFENYLEKRNGSLYAHILPGQPAKGWTSAATSMGSDSTTYVKWDYSLAVTFGAGEIYKNFTNNAYFNLFNMASIWAKRPAGAGKLQVTFYNEAYASRTNGYRFYVSGSATWVQTVVAMSSSDYSHVTNNVGSPTGWNKIKSIVIEASGGATDNSPWKLDAFFLGIGFKLQSPRGDYDGIYVFNDFQWEEAGGNTYTFAYKITLTDQTQVFGRLRDAV